MPESTFAPNANAAATHLKYLWEDDEAERGVTILDLG